MAGFFILLTALVLVPQLRAETGYESWAEINVSGQDPQQDYDNDGIRNGVEYFFGIGPSDPVFTPNPHIENGKIRWPFAGVEDFSFKVQFSTNLDIGWQSVDPANLDFSEAGFVAYTLPIQPSGGRGYFVRLAIEYPSPTPELSRFLFANSVEGDAALQWRPLMESPPIVTSGTSTSIVNGVGFRPFLNGAKQPGFDKLLLLGGDWVPAGSSGTRANFSKPLSGPINTSGAVEFQTDSRVVSLSVHPGFSGSDMRCNIGFWVNGHPISAAPIYTKTNAGTPEVFTLTFPDAQMRDIRAEFGLSTEFGSVTVEAGRNVSKPARQPLRVIVMGDSFTEPTGVIDGRIWDGFAQRLAQKTQWDVWASGSGGTGYVNPGSGGRIKLRNRLSTGALAYSPDVIIWAGGINDANVTFYVGDAVYKEAIAAYKRVKEVLPQCIQVVVGPWWPNAFPTADVLAVRDQLKRAAETSGLAFIDPIESGKLWIDAGNKLSYHPNGRATGKAVLSEMVVSSVDITNGGLGYPVAPSVSFSGGGGTGAKGVAIMDGRVQSVSMLAGGTDYTSPVVGFIGGGNGSGATAVATVVGGKITGITITNEGTGYTSQPLVVITDTTGAGAVAVAAQTFKVESVLITNGGSGYTGLPSVVFSSSSDATHPTTVGHAFYAEKLCRSLLDVAK